MMPQRTPATSGFTGEPGKYYDVLKKEFLPFPKANYYVISTDTFLSNCGRARGKKNKCVVPCSDYTLATQVASYVSSRTDQKNIRIGKHAPMEHVDVLYSIVPEWLIRGTEHLKTR